MVLMVLIFARLGHKYASPTLQSFEDITITRFLNMSTFQHCNSPTRPFYFSIQHARRFHFGISNTMQDLNRSLFIISDHYNILNLISTFDIVSLNPTSIVRSFRGIHFTSRFFSRLTFTAPCHLRFCSQSRSTFAISGDIQAPIPNRWPPCGCPQPMLYL